MRFTGSVRRCGGVITMIVEDTKRRFCVTSTERRIELLQLVCDAVGEDRDELIREWSLKYIIETLESDKTSFIYDEQTINEVRSVFGS